MTVLELLYEHLFLGPLLTPLLLVLTIVVILSYLPWYLSLIVIIIFIILPKQLQTLKFIRQKTGKSYITILREIIYFKNFSELIKGYGSFRQYSLIKGYGRFIQYSLINLLVMVYCTVGLYSSKQDYFILLLLALLQTFLVKNFELKQIKQITAYKTEKNQMIFFLMLIRNIIRFFSLKYFFTYLLPSFSSSLLTETISYIIGTLLIIISVPFDVLIMQICQSDDYSIEELREEFKNLSLKYFRGTLIVLIQELTVIFISILAITVASA